VNGVLVPDAHVLFIAFIAVAIIATACTEQMKAVYMQRVYSYNLLFIALLTSAMLSISIEFFLVDARAAAAIVEDLNSLAKMESLSLHTLNAARTEVMVDRSAVSCSLLSVSLLVVVVICARLWCCV
jgi:ABC-type uncharacterized transport system involved in gliding motility auxiliary subunit